MTSTATVPPVVGPNEVILDVWLGDSQTYGLRADEAEVVDPASPVTLTGTQLWSKWADATNRFNASGTHTFADHVFTPATFGGKNITTFSYGQGLLHASRSNPVGVKDGAQTDWHKVVLLGASSSVAHTDVNLIANKLAHWSPTVTGAGTGTDFGALQLLKQEYLTKALQELQAEGRRIRLGAVYMSINGDAAAATTTAALMRSYPVHMGQIIRDLEDFFGVYSIPVVLIGGPHITFSDFSDFRFLDTVREMQMQIAADRPNTLFFDTRPYPISEADMVHLNGQATVDIGKAATDQRYRHLSGIVPITKSF